MQRIIIMVTLLAGVFLLPAAPVSAWFFSGDTLVTIDDTDYSSEDFKRWWKYWNTEDEPVPETPDPYINWLLLSREGERMQLDQEPGFQRSSRIFLQARGLLMLKYDAVDSKIEVTDEQIKQQYEQDYTPRWLVQRLTFADEEAAAAAWEGLNAGEFEIAELVEREPAEGGPTAKNESWVRPMGIDPGWVELFNQTEVGALVDPGGHEQGPELYFIKEQKGGDADDLETFKERISRDLWKRQEAQLTQELLQQLYEKYQVEIDQERLDALDLNAADDSFSDEPVITTSREDVSEKEFIAVIRRLQQSRPVAAHAGADAEEAAALKKETVDNIIAQSLTNWESLDRKFEEREPFKWEYQFNYNHRLTLAVEEHQYASSIQVSDAQIEDYYNNNMERFTQPEMVKLYIVAETSAPVDRFWAEVATGKDFKQLLREHFEQRVPPQEVPIDHLDPEIRVVADRLSKGETSQIFTAQGVRVMVHLEDRTSARPLPLERAKESIRTQLRSEMLDQARAEYLEALKNHSRIDVKTRKWRSLRKELGGA